MGMFYDANDNYSRAMFVTGLYRGSLAAMMVVLEKHELPIPEQVLDAVRVADKIMDELMRVNAGKLKPTEPPAERDQ